MAIRVKRRVIPGENLAEAEEFSEGENAFQEGEKIYSQAVGYAEYDHNAHEVRVIPDKEIKVFSKGCKVLGQVMAVRKSRVLVNLFSASEGPEKRIVNQSHATLFVSKVDERYITSLSDEFKIGDIIAAEVEDIKPYGIYLSTNKPSLGVIKAFCSRCRAPLYRKGDKLFCKRCGSIEKRKLSEDYILKME